MLSLKSTLAAAILLTIGGIPLFAQNLIENGSFEEALKGWIVRAANTAVAQALPEAASLGEKGLRVQSTPDCPSFEVVSTPMTATPGKTYCVDFWSGGGELKGDGVSVRMVFKGPNSEPLKPAMAAIRKWPGIKVGGGAFFKHNTLAAAAPEGATTLSVQISSADKKPCAAVDLDDFRVTEYVDSPDSPEAQAAKAHKPPPWDTPCIQAFLEDIKRDPHRGKAPPRIVLKLDDLGPVKGSVHPKWIKVANFAKERKIKAAFGIVAKGMEEDNPAFFQWVKTANAEGQIEFWNHGYDHVGNDKIKEFAGQPYEYQKEHLVRCNQLAREKLGFPFVSFGAPFNAADGAAVRALSEDPDIKVWMYGNSKNTAGKTVLKRCDVTIETPTFLANYAAFIEAYAHNRGASYFVMQGHPTHWDNERFEQFRMIVDFLIAQNAVFVMPRELAEVVSYNM